MKLPEKIKKIAISMLLSVGITSGGTAISANSNAHKNDMATSETPTDTAQNEHKPDAETTKNTDNSKYDKLMENLSSGGKLQDENPSILKEIITNGKDLKKEISGVSIGITSEGGGIRAIVIDRRNKDEVNVQTSGITSDGKHIDNILKIKGKESTITTEDREGTPVDPEILKKINKKSYSKPSIPLTKDEIRRTAQKNWTESTQKKSERTPKEIAAKPASDSAHSIS